MRKETMRELAIKAENVEKAFKELKAVNRLSFEVPGVSVLVFWAPTVPGKPP